MTGLRDVAVVVTDGVAPFELGVLCEVFGVDRSDDGLPTYDFAVCAPTPGPVRTSAGFGLDVRHGLDRLATADLVAVPAMPYADPDPAVLDALRAAVDRGARVLSVCTGAFVLGAAGLLDGRRCTTHWRHTEELAGAFPLAEVHPDVLYVEDGPVLTSAGSAAGIDLGLHVVREAHGVRVATTIARRMVVPPHREGGQAQYVTTPIAVAAHCERLEPVLEWMTAHLDEELPVEQLAAKALMSPRTFARRFRAETGTTPFLWLTSQRVLAAQRLLEDTDDSIDAVAEQCGFGTAAVLRHHFARHRGTTPLAYRRTFRQRPA